MGIHGKVILNTILKKLPDAEAIFVGDDPNWRRLTSNLRALEPTDATSHSAAIAFIGFAIQEHPQNKHILHRFPSCSGFSIQKKLDRIHEPNACEKWLHQ